MALTLTFIPLCFLFYATYWMARHLFLDRAYSMRLQMNQTHQNMVLAVQHAQTGYEQHAKEKRIKVQEYALHIVATMAEQPKGRVFHASFTSVQPGAHFDEQHLCETLQRGIRTEKTPLMMTLFSPSSLVKDDV